MPTLELTVELSADLLAPSSEQNNSHKMLAARSTPSVLFEVLRTKIFITANDGAQTINALLRV
jgi:hypothetical protein